MVREGQRGPSASWQGKEHSAGFSVDAADRRTSHPTRYRRGKGYVSVIMLLLDLGNLSHRRLAVHLRVFATHVEEAGKKQEPFHYVIALA